MNTSAVLNAARQARAELLEVNPHVMEKLSYGHGVEGIVAVARPPRRILSDIPVTDRSLVAVVEGVEKPGNLGAIVRTADAAGVSAVVVASGGTDLFNPNVIRASLARSSPCPCVLPTRLKCWPGFRLGTFASSLPMWREA